MIKRFSFWIFTTIFGLAVAFFTERYLSPSIDVVYYVESVSVPLLLKKSFDSNEANEQTEYQLLKLFINNYSNDEADIQRIHISGIKKHFHSSLKKGSQQIKSVNLFQNPETSGFITIFENGQHSLKVSPRNKIEIQILGIFQKFTYVEIIINGQHYTADTANWVTGAEKYVSIYWKFILGVLIIITLLFVYLCNEKNKLSKGIKKNK